MTEELEFDYVIVGAGAARTISWQMHRHLPDRI